MTGEGFAYFRWHVIKFSTMEGQFPAAGCLGCYRWWNEMQGRV